MLSSSHSEAVSMRPIPAPRRRRLEPPAAPLTLDEALALRPACLH
jgi:hypothetical protein